MLTSILAITMEQGQSRLSWQAPPKIPAMEVINLDSDEDDAEKPLDLRTFEKSRDAFLEDSVSDDDTQSRDSQWSMLEDALQQVAEDEDDDALHESMYGHWSFLPNSLPVVQAQTLIFWTGEDACTPDEALAFRKRLRLIGGDRFYNETVKLGLITAKKLCTAFGIRAQPYFEGAPDEAYEPLLQLGICRELSKRVKLPQFNTIEDAVSLLQKSRKIIVLTGAGVSAVAAHQDCRIVTDWRKQISTSLGIPDFRSKHTGLYAQLEHLGLSDPQEVFDISVFREDPSIFYSIAKDILPSSKRFSPTHAFIRLLQDKDKLLTNFTQNIDNLEGHAGISSKRLIQCHGSFATATCIECRYKVPCEKIYYDLKAGKVARCDRCIQRIREVKPGMKRKRSSNGSKNPKKNRKDHEDSTDNEDDDIAVAGVMKVKPLSPLH